MGESAGGGSAHSLAASQRRCSGELCVAAREGQARRAGALFCTTIATRHLMIEPRLALFSYQDYHILLPTLAGALEELPAGLRAATGRRTLYNWH